MTVRLVYSICYSVRSVRTQQCCAEYSAWQASNDHQLRCLFTLRHVHIGEDARMRSLADSIVPERFSVMFQSPHTDQCQDDWWIPARGRHQISIVWLRAQLAGPLCTQRLRSMDDGRRVGHDSRVTSVNSRWLMKTCVSE